MKILGFGIDLECMNRFDAKISNIDDYLIRRFLTENEYDEYSHITSRHGKARFLCSHWTAKEAVYKALKLVDHPLNKIEISRLKNGHLTFRPEGIDIVGHLSVTYSEGFCAVACVLVVEEPENKLYHQHDYKENYQKKLGGNQQPAGPDLPHSKSSKTQLREVEHAKYLLDDSVAQILKVLNQFADTTKKELKEMVHTLKEGNKKKEDYNSHSQKLYSRTHQIKLNQPKHEDQESNSSDSNDQTKDTDGQKFYKPYKSRNYFKKRFQNKKQ